jgi:Uncharacterized protein conserved in bacteria (DUF2252)
VGSVGTFCGIGLLTAGDGSVLLLQLKEAQELVLARFAGNNHSADLGEMQVHRLSVDGRQHEKPTARTEGDHSRDIHDRQARTTLTPWTCTIMLPAFGGPARRERSRPVLRAA